jgi:hypothetical protein
VLWIRNRLQKLDLLVIVATRVSVLQVVAGSLMKVLRGPESTIGDIYVDGETSGSRNIWARNGSNRLFKS